MQKIPPSALIILGPASNQFPGYRQVIDGITYETNGISWAEITEDDVSAIFTPETMPDPAAAGIGAECVVAGRSLKSNGSAWLSAANDMSGQPKLCFVGSSLTQHGNGWGPTKISTDTRGWPCWLMMMLQDSAIAEQWTYVAPDTKQYTVGSNRGFSGQFASQIEARKADIAAMNADIYIIQQGTNDLASIDSAVTCAAVESLAKYLRNTGAIVVLLTEPCRNFSVGSGWESGGVAQKRREYLNTFKRKLARDNHGILCVESDKYLMLATGEASSGVLYDGTHFTPNGAYLLAKSVYDTIAGAVLAIRQRIINNQGVYDATYNPDGNLVGNPILATAATGFTKSALPTGVTAFNIVNNSDGTATITVTTDGSGTAGAVSSVSLLQTSPKAHAANDAIRCAVKIKSVTQADNLYGVKAYVRAVKSGETSVYAFGCEKYISGSYAGTKTSYWPVNGVSMLNRTPALVVPWSGGTISVGLFIDVNAGVAGTNIITVEGIDARQGQLPWDAVGVDQDTGYASQNIYGGTDV